MSGSGDSVRRAVGGTVELLETYKRYMPSNYYVSGMIDDRVEVCGHDVGGWTLSGYVLPRLASGGHFFEEVVR